MTLVSNIPNEHGRYLTTEGRWWVPGRSPFSMSFVKGRGWVVWGQGDMGYLSESPCDTL